MKIKGGLINNHPTRKKKNLTNDLETSEIKFRRLFETSQDGILLVDAETGEITDVNPYLLLMLSYPREEVVGKALWELSPLKDVMVSKKAFQELQSKKYIRYDNLPLETKKGKLFYAEFISNVYEVNGKNVIQCNIRDITERVLAEKKVAFISNHDTLTNLYNRSYFDEEMHRLENSRHYPISIFMFDVDNLKAVNDQFGHMAGDEYLKQTAQVLKSSFRDEDIIARIGGDEFSVLLPNTSAKAAEAIRTRIENALNQYNENHPAMIIHVSIGVATCEETCSLFQLLQQADDRMYDQKKTKAAKKPVSSG
jgi:diguanylate cyclase (GGDEF)-like protein/PAS domain S-box-containing protein